MSNVSSSSPQLVGNFIDTGNQLFYGSGTKGANASNPGDPYENLAMVAKNGDSLTYTATKTANGNDNQVTYSRESADNELISRDLGTGDLTALDNNKKYTTDKNGDIFASGTDGKDAKRIGNIHDSNEQSELTSSGMSQQAAQDFHRVGQTGAIQSLSGVQDDFSSPDRQVFNEVASQSIYDQQNPPMGAATTNQEQSISQSLMQIFGV